MSIFILLRSSPALRAAFSTIPCLYPSLYAFRAASLNSGINRGLRRSKNVGLRRQERTRSEGSRDEQSNGLIRRSADPPPVSGSQISRDGWRGSSGQLHAKAGRESRPMRIRRGKKLIKDEEDPRKSVLSGNRAFMRGSPRQSGSDQSGRTMWLRQHNQKQSAYTPRDSQLSKTISLDRHNTSFENRSLDQRRNLNGNYPSLSRSRSSYDPNGRKEERNSYNPQHQSNKQDDDTSSIGSRSSRPDDKRMPLSIPYTTPASEFLYGTSVVVAALNSQRDPRRKLYKLYIYTGESRESVDPASLERQARRKGIEVARVGTDWLRVLDKMSGGRPHNGYILEASPLPRLPVANLGELTDRDGEPGFKVTVEHQSREDAAVNGTFDFIKLPRNSWRKPFVLFLDSIEDPGNLGSIIRTASFLGVTAVAFSARNSASFTPVVLKASAGAAENVTLFSVNKPAGFIANSKLAGWKIFAAVTPSRSRAPNAPPAISADDMQDPLSEDPCILMLGGEGAGLRANLRSKADVELSIRGSGPSQNLDSLNVGVAAGILCSAFLRRSQAKRRAAPIHQVVESESTTNPTGDIF